MASSMEETRSHNGAGRDCATNGAESRRHGWGETPVIESSKLFHGSTEIGIAHEGALYRLKITRQGKLVLNK